MVRCIPAFIVIAIALLPGCDVRAASAGVDAIFHDGFDPYGALLEGPPDRLAIDAIVDMPPIPAPEGDIEDDLILTRLDLFIDRTATVAQINAAVTEVGGLIVTMTPGRSALTISIPRAADRAGLRDKRDVLRAHAGILMAALAEVSAEHMLPDPPAGDFAHAGYLHASRFPAAWNASRLATANCASRKVTMRFLDHFRALPQPLADVVSDQLPGFHLLTPPTTRQTNHGYEVAMTAAARFDSVNQTGANPFPQCLDLQGTDASGLSWVQRAWLSSAGIGDAHAVVNASIGNHRPCSTSCRPADFDAVDIVVDAFRAIDWRAGSRAHDGNVIYVTAAGNNLDLPIAGLFPYYAAADFASPMNLSASPEFLGETPPDDSDDFAFLRSQFLLDPIDPAYPSLVANDADIQRVRTYASQNLGIGAVRSPNVLVTGSTTREAETVQTHVSVFSNTGSTVQAVGEGIIGFDERPGSGTSLSAPQVSGLVSYLWLLSDDLRAAPLAATVAAITSNARSVNGATLLDAYASVLSLDAADPMSVTPSPQTMPIRLALLDIDGDGRFTDADLTMFQEHLLLNGGSAQQQDGSRYDLNGDGYTGGFHADRFDLDRVGSSRFGSSSYTRVTESIEGQMRWFDESQLLDIDILCYYAYSPLYTGDTGIRMQSIGATCGDPFGGHAELDFGSGSGIYLKNGFSGGGSGYIYAAGYTFLELPTVQRFSFATMGWGAPARLVPDTDVNYRLAGFAANPHDAVALLGSGIPDADMKSRRYDLPTDSWSEDVFTGIYAAPRFAPHELDPAFSLSANGSAVAAWVAGSADTQRDLVASRLDPVTQQWSPPDVVVEGLSGPLTTRPSALADDSGNFYLVAYALSVPPTIHRFDRSAGTWGAMEAFPGEFIYSLGVDPAGRLLAVGGANGGAMSSRYDPATGHWSTPVTLPVPSMYNPSALASSVPGARYGGGSEGCQMRLLCIDAKGNAIALLSVAPSEGPNAPVTLGAFHFDAGSNRWRSLGVIGRGTNFSIGMGYHSGNADIAWATDTYGSLYVRHVDARNGMGAAQMFFQSSPAHYFLVPPAILHDEGDAAIVVWGSQSESSPVVYYWMTVH